MSTFIEICGDTISLKNVQSVIIDEEVRGFFFWRTSEWTLDITYENEESITWRFSSEKELSEVKAAINLHLFAQN